MSSTLQERLLEARKISGYSQQQVADKIGMKQPTYSALEKSGGGSKRTTFLPEIAFVLGVRAYWLATGEGPREEGDLPDLKERELVNAWRTFPDESKEAVLSLFRTLRQSGDEPD